MKNYTPSKAVLEKVVAYATATSATESNARFNEAYYQVEKETRMKHNDIVKLIRDLAVQAGTLS